MADPKLLQSDYSRGSISDLARHLIPRSSVWRMTDYLPNYGGAPLAKRGGWTDASPALGSQTAVAAVAFAPFSGGSQLVAITPDGHLWKVDSSSSATDKGAAAIPIQRPVFFNNQLLIPGATPMKYDGSAAPSALGGTPPGGVYGFTYKGRFYLAGSAANPNRVWPSDILNAALWNTTTGYMDMTNPIRGAAPLRNAILVWSDGMTERIRGDTPPPGGDMVREPIFEEGCVDARSIVVHGDKAIWANSNGVHISDGAAVANLIQLGGQQQLWSNLFASYSSSWTVAGGTLRGDYIIVIMNGTTVLLAAMCDVDNKSWRFLNNIPAAMFAEAYGARPELYFAQGARGRVGAFSPIYLPTSSNKADGDGTNVQPVIETQYFRGSPGSRRWKDIYLGNDITTVDGAYLQVSYINHPESTSYVDLPDTIAAAGQYQRSKVPLRLANDGFALKIQQVGPSAQTLLYDIEASVIEREGSRR
jgi:hypothetical protein